MFEIIHQKIQKLIIEIGLNHIIINFKKYNMAGIKFTEALRKEYETLFNTCIIRPERVIAVNDIVKKYW